MPNVLVRNLPEDVHAVLLRRAEANGQSLQQYLTAELSRLAEKPTIEEWVARIERRRGGSLGFNEAVAARDAERERR
jgi:plasmid stability protein